MIQERLEEIRQDATIECATNIAAVSWRSMVVGLLAHIDEQDKDDLNNGLMANCNQLRTRCWKAEEDCKRWQQAAIESKAVLHFVNFPSREQVFYLQPKEIQDNYRKQAAKELGLRMEQEASYTDRLERLALSMCLEAGWDQSDFEAALAKIKDGKP